MNESTTLLFSGDVVAKVQQLGEGAKITLTEKAKKLPGYRDWMRRHGPTTVLGMNKGNAKKKVRAALTTSTEREATEVDEEWTDHAKNCTKSVSERPFRLGGNTYPYKEEISGMGFYYDGETKTWYTYDESKWVYLKDKFGAFSTEPRTAKIP